MKVKVLFFASAKEATGKKKVELDLEGEENTVKHLMNKLEGMFPDLNFQRDQISLAVNQVYCSTGAILAEGDEVALLPPISGG